MNAVPATHVSPHRARYRVIYGDTDTMGIVYHANYFRWFEIGRAELFRDLGLPYKTIEEKGVVLPVTEVMCKYLAPARYDDLLIIETTVDLSFRAGIQFRYRILTEAAETLLAEGYTKHAFVDAKGRVVRPPEFIAVLVRQHFSGQTAAEHP